MIGAARCQEPPPGGQAAAAATPSAGPQAPPASPAAPARTPDVNFFIEIQPIFTLYCIKCHGPEKRSGGLRLDAESFAASGGDSRKPILHGTLETNELYHRVSSSERTYRMPKNADRLPNEAIERIKKWVEQGTPWPATFAQSPSSKLPFYERWLSWFGETSDHYKFELALVQPYAVAFLLAQLALAAVSRAKTAYQNNRSWARGKAAWFCRPCSRVTTGEMFLVWLLMLAAGAGIIVWGHEQKLAVDLAKARADRVPLESPWAKTIFGYPPVPFHPDHPKQIAGTYYRGNCERNPALFNNGNYLTALFHIALCDVEHKVLEVGSPFPQGGLFVRIEIERAPGTADVLFSRELMASVFLSDKFHGNELEKLKEQPARLETLEEAKRWVAYVPTGSPDANGKLVGLIYMYTGRIENEMVRGDPHYGVKYDLSFVDGKLSAESELWMNSFGNGAFVQPELPGKLPYREWFDYRPIPAITGENSTDPKLRGVEEYIQKGLLKPEAAGQPVRSDTAPKRASGPENGKLPAGGASQDDGAPKGDSPPSGGSTPDSDE